MKRIATIIVIILLFSCSKDDEPDRLMYDITYTVTVSNGTTINRVEYLDNRGERVELFNLTPPWTTSLRVRAGLALEAAAYGDIPYQGSLSINAVWTPDGGTTQTETVTLSNDTPNTTIDDGRVEISGRTLPD